MTFSRLSPKIHRYSMFPPRCIHPPWRNIDVKSVAQNGSGIVGAMSRPTVYSRGTTPQA